MPSTGDPRNGRPYRRLLAQVRAEEPDCCLCGLPIDQTRDPQRDPLGSTLEHLTPVNDGGTNSRSNAGHAHRCCNSLRQDRPVTPELRAACRQRVAEHLAGPAQPTHWTRRW